VERSEPLSTLPKTWALKPEWTWTPGGIARNLAVVMDDTGSIVEVVPAERYPEGGEALPGRLLMPGLVNAHSHAFQRGFRGHVERREAEDRGAQDDFWGWRVRMYGLANGLDPEGVRAVSALAFLEMLEAGITRVGEFHYLHHQPDGTPYDDPDRLAHGVLQAAADVGIGITLLRVAYATGGIGTPPAPNQRRFVDRRVEDALTALERLGSEGHDVGLAPHSVRAVPEAGLRDLSAWGGVVHCHVSEQPAENEACVAAYGRSPLGVLHDAGLVGEGFTAVHLTHPMQGDIDRLVQAGGTVCVCPSTELHLGDGFLPMEARTRLPMSLGSDSHAWIDLLREASTLELHGRGVAGRRHVLDGAAVPGSSLAERMLWSATQGGARSLGRPPARIEAGAPADLVALDLRRPAALGVPPLEAVAFAGTADWVDQVWVGGRLVVRDGRHPARTEVLRQADRVLRDVFS